MKTSPVLVVPSLIHRDSLDTGHHSRSWTLILHLLDVWKRLQVSYYGGKYSIHRVLALEEYTESTSLSRVILICISTPMPTVALVLIQEAVPLQDPKLGWSENYGFWIRVAMLALVISVMCADQTNYLIDGVVISWRQMILLSLMASCAFTVCATYLSAHLMFPIPFSVLTLAPLFYPWLIFSYRIVVGGRVFRELFRHQEQLIRYLTFIVVEVMIAAIYPAYEILFRLAQGSSYQIFVILLLPVIKVIIKNIVLRCMAHMEDMVPEAVIFTVDFFNAIYIATCMQSATSAIAMTAIAVTDLSQTAIMLYGLHRRTVSILPKLHAVIGDAARNNNLLTGLRSLSCDHDKFEKQNRESVRIKSCYPHKLSNGSEALLEMLLAIPSRYHVEYNVITPLSGPDVSNIVKVKPSKLQRFSSFCTRRIGGHHIVPEAPRSTLSAPGSSQKSIGSYRSQSVSRRSTVLRESLEVLFSLECLITTAYLEAAIPFFYSTYIVIMTLLPSAKYHSEMTGITTENVGTKVLFLIGFGLLQVFSFALLLALVKKNCGMKAWYQLAFVLDTQMSLAQGKIVAWTVITICFRVVHFGVDFTFKFSASPTKT